MAVKQVAVQLDFEAADLPAEEGLRHAKRSGGARKTAVLGDANEIPELFEFQFFRETGDDIGGLNISTAPAAAAYAAGA
jgi:hypothetical protein